MAEVKKCIRFIKLNMSIHLDWTEIPVIIQLYEHNNTHF